MDWRPNFGVDNESSRDDVEEVERLRHALVVARKEARARTGAETIPPPERAAYVHCSQALARAALAAGRVDVARTALRWLRSSDLHGESDVVEGLLGVTRDSRSTEQDVTEALRQVCGLEPAR
jgi:hypothetical protein